jgi:acetoin utilization deacetylase AcuC-like enzyme
MNVGFVSNPQMVLHDTGPGHPERADRLRAIHRALRQIRLLRSEDPFPEFPLQFQFPEQFCEPQPLVEIAPVPVELDVPMLVHSNEYIDRVRRVCEAGGVLDQGDTPVCPKSFETAMLSLSCATTAVDAVMSGSVDRAFSCARPPGHHAESDRPMGFCLFSNIAIAAKYARRQHGVDRIAIVDFDVHHGNGTQQVFETDDSVLFASIHQDPRTCYPGSGHEWERGTGKGEGFTINVPMQPGTTDADWTRAIDEKIVPVVAGFKPELLMISAGFDGHLEDPLAQVNLSDEAYFKMTRQLCRLADAHCAGRVVSVLEGGYNLRALGRSVVRHVSALFMTDPS